MKEDDLKRFGRVKAGYEPINRSTIKKPKSASLWFDDGAVNKLLKNNISFPMAEYHRKKYIELGYKRKYLSIKYAV